jgi:hypothetical protein
MGKRLCFDFSTLRKYPSRVPIKSPGNHNRYGFVCLALAGALSLNIRQRSA